MIGGTPLLQIAAAYDNWFEFRSEYNEDSVLLPSLIKDWQVADAGRTWTINIRPGIKWHNKAPVNGRDFVASDLCNTISIYTAASVYGSEWADVDSCTATNASTAVIKLKQFSGAFFYNFSAMENIPIAKEAWEKFKGADNSYPSTADAIIGTGPWVMTGADATNGLVFSRNASYWKLGRDGQSLPYIDQFVFIPMSSDDVRKAAIATAKIDLWRVPGGSGTTRRDFETIIKATEPKGYRWLPGARPVIFLLQLNPKRATFADPTARKAASLAINRDDIIAAAFGGDGVWTGWVPGGVDGSLSQEQLRQTFKYDANQAKSLLAGSAYAKAGSPEILFRSSNEGAGYQTASVAILDMLQKAGFKVKPQFTDGAVLYDSRSTLDYDLLLYTITPATNNPFFWVNTLYDPKSPANLVGWNDPQVADMITRASSTTDAKERDDLIIKAQQRMAELTFDIPMFTDVRYDFLPPYLKNVRPPHWTYFYNNVVTAWLER